MPVCPAHIQRAISRGWDANNLFVYYPEGAPPEPGVYNVGGICVNVQPGAYQEQAPPGATVIGVGSKPDYDSCSDCTDGGLATLCPEDQNLPGADQAPDIWIRKPDIGTTGSVAGFQFGNWCYQMPDSATGSIPVGAIIYHPSDEVTCDNCAPGVQYHRCPGEPKPPYETWAPKSGIDALLDQYPDLTTVTMRISGICYTLDLPAQPSRIPPDAHVVNPRCAYADCEACICHGDKAGACDSQDDKGIPVKPCADQDMSHWKETWLRTSGGASGDGASGGPSGMRWFLYDGYCVFVDPSASSSTIPTDARVIGSISSDYDDCESCLRDSRGGGGPGGGGGGYDECKRNPNLPWCNDPCTYYAKGNPFRPFWCDGPPKIKEYFLLKDCQTGKVTDRYVLGPQFCGVYNIVPCDLVGLAFKWGDDKCYEIVGPGYLDPPGVPAEPPISFSYLGCEECPPKDGCYHISGGPPGEGRGDCCAAGGCCNYAGTPIDELLTGGPPTWSANGRGPSGTSDWSLTRSGTYPNYSWTLRNDCEVGCHIDAYRGSVNWDGEDSHVFQMGAYPAITVTKVDCP